MTKPLITLPEEQMFLIICVLSWIITMSLFRYLRWKHPERFKDE